MKPGRQDLVLERVAVDDVDGDGRRHGRVAGGVPRPSGQRVRAVGEAARVPHGAVGLDRVLGADARAVDEELHAGDADVVARVGRDVDDVAHLGVVRGRDDGHRRRRRVARGEASGVFMSVWTSAWVSVRL